MKKNYLFTLLLTLCFSAFSFGQIVINEVDADTPGTDEMEFIELKWTPNTALDGYVVVLFNGSDDKSYIAYDLDGKTTDANGFFILGNTGVAGIDIDMGANNKLQNGADAVAIYLGDETDFPNDTPISTTNLIDVLIYDTNDGDDSGLMTGFGVTIQYNEGENGDKDNQSIQRHTDGTYQVLAPSLRAENQTSSAATLSFSSPSNNQVFNPSTNIVPITFNIQNFTLSGDNGSEMSDNTGDGYIFGSLKVNGVADGTQNIFSETTTDIEGITPGSSYEVTAELLDNSGASLSPKVETTITFTVAAYTNINSISQLRAGTEGDYYNLSGDNVTLTYARSSRNQKYIQDQTGGILIDDSAGVITTTYNQFDVIPDLKGRLSSFNGIMQFVPDVDPGASTFTNDLIPEVVTLANFVANYGDYESEYIKIEDISFDAADVGNNFASSTSYDVSSGTTMSVFRTNFSEADYIGTAIPSGPVSMNVIGGSFSGVGQITAINLTDLVLRLNNNTIQGFATYPNPVTNKRFTVTTSSSDIKQVSIFNVLGKRVFSTSFSGAKSNVDVSSISSGLYILKVSEGDKIATSKLVVK